MVTMVGVVPGLPWIFQMVPRDQQVFADERFRAAEHSTTYVEEYLDVS